MARQKLLKVYGRVPHSLGRIFIPIRSNSFLNCSGDRPLPEESRRRGGEIWRHVEQSSPCLQQQSERKVWGGPQEGDQKAAATARPNQDLDRFGWNQRQIRSLRETEAYRGGKYFIRSFLQHHSSVKMLHPKVLKTRLEFFFSTMYSVRMKRCQNSRNVTIIAHFLF